jgi:hypothetical protein
VESQAFTKISKSEDREKLIKDMVAAGVEILCKGQPDTIYRLKAAKFSNNKLYCSLSPNSAKLAVTHEVLIASFMLGGDKYFFQSVAQYEGIEIFFIAEFDLFHLQRRQNYRVKIPESYKAIMNVTDVNDQTIKLTANLYDISSGGCRMVYQNDKVILKMDDVLKTRVTIGSKDPLEITAMVRHIALDPLNKKASVLGLEFKPLSPALESRLFAITMDLHRELFSKLN